MKNHSILKVCLLGVGLGLGAAACDSAESGDGDGGGAKGGTSASGSGGTAGVAGKGGATSTGGTGGGSSGDAGDSSGGTAGASAGTGSGASGGTGGDAAGNGGTSAASSGGTAGTSGSEAGGTAGDSSGGTAGAVGGAGGAGAGGAGAGGTAASAGTAGTGPSCDVGGLQVFPRSDTDQSWDDNDFSDVILSGYCPTLVDVTWPHEAGWENADPAEANHEATHFTLDSYSATGDLTGKQVNLTIELASDVRGAGATDGYYLVSLVSVSTYDRIVSGSGGTGGETTVTETGYAEAESATRPLLVVGDRVRLTFPLPSKTEEVDSYDPSRVIKVNVRVYNAFSSTALLEDEGGNEGEGGAAGETGTGGSGGSGGSSGTAGTGGTETGGTAGTGGAAGTSGTAGTGGSPGTPYDYRTSQFAIVDFNVTDAP